MMPDSAMQHHVKWFRGSAPYINAHRNKTFVLFLSGDALAHTNFANIVNDIALLHSLGVRLVLVHGATAQIDQNLSDRGISCSFEQNTRITDEKTLACIEETVGKLRIQIEARLSMGIVNSPMHGAEIHLSSGNFIKAKPLGIRQGIDYQHSGDVRKVNVKAINQQLDNGALVLISPLGYSPTGEILNLSAAELATRVATDTKAEKIVYFDLQQGVLDTDGAVISEIQPSKIRPENFQNGVVPKHLDLAADACQKGVNRCHLISFAEDGALLEELFTRDGAGTQVCRESYEQIRTATIEDVAGIIELISPLEDQGVLVKRSRELLETEISCFSVIIRDGTVVGCAALYPFDNRGELACLATHPDYRNSERGELLLQTIEKQARRLGLNSLFVLTTQSVHWFQERGFNIDSLDQLPEQKKSLYNYQRNSKVYSKAL
jgi:amino-acid N-acetyltransferase